MARSADSIHAELLHRLLALAGAAGYHGAGAARPCLSAVRLIARFCDEDLVGAGDDPTVYVFFPDFHLVESATASRYRFGFDTSGQGAVVDRAAILEALCEHLLGFRGTLEDDQELRVVHLGDFVDLWRDPPATTGIPAKVASILRDHPVAHRRLVTRRPASGRSGGTLSADFLRGNHDLDADRAPLLSHARRAFAYERDGRRSLLATHGDLFDLIERKIPEGVRRWAVKSIGPEVAATRYPIDRTRDQRRATGREEGRDRPPPDPPANGPDGRPPLTLRQAPTWLPTTLNIWVTTEAAREYTQSWSHVLLPIALDCARGLRHGVAEILQKMDLRAPADRAGLPDLRVLVVGHSHRPCICVHEDADDPHQNLVLVDCGAWIETSEFADGDVPSCHLGILCGPDIRLYQLDPA
ncbi:MAG: hypothetical protein HZA54_17300 [Planctomycetes bacterium]|nr:hypothetical protein [Planctomycetota bacterium]